MFSCSPWVQKYIVNFFLLGGGCLVHSWKKVTVFYLNIYHFAQQEQSAIEKLKFIREKCNFIIGLKSVKIMAWKD